MNIQNQAHEKESSNFSVVSLVAFFITLGKKEYRTIIQGLLPEVLRQNKLSQAEMDNVLKKWGIFPEDSGEELQFHTISKLLKRGIWLNQWIWPITLGIIGLGLTAIGILATRASENDSITTPELPLPVCKTLNNYVPVAEFVELEDNYSPDFNGGKLTVKFTQNGTPNDCLAILKGGDIGIIGSNVIYEGNVIGSFQGGEGAETFVVDFNEKATGERVQAVARRVAYSLDDSENPSYGSRTIEFQVTDGDGGDSLKKGLLRQTIQVVNKNNPIAINAPNSQTVKENTNLPIGSISINASDSQKVIVTLGVENGTLSVKENVANGISTNGIANNQTSKVTISGTVAEVNTTLADTGAVIYKGKQKFSGDDSLTITVSEDRSGVKNIVMWPPFAQNPQSVSKSIDIKVEAANPAPVITVPSSQLTTNENEKLGIGIGGITISDLNNQNVSLTLEVNRGKLILKTDIAEGLPSDNIKDNETNKVTLDGSVERINNTLAGTNNLIYESNQNYSGKDFLTITANDGEKTTTKRVPITVNDHPKLNNPEFVTTSSGRKITRYQAVDRIKSWLKVKSRVFGSSYDRRILRQYTTGKYLRNGIEAINELRSNRQRYTFYTPKTEPQKEFFVKGNQVIIYVKVVESYGFWNNGIFDGRYSNEGIYSWTLQFDDKDNRWKIAASEKIN
ncbi:MAG: DUF4101 domain-containing protein [Okeania sp. SIO2C9]|uniref:IMS domain-containing protein n=1 Tax=Okeania sp. SIO2C9 TaxID=2607791 RepID=UPI0013C1C4E9|nr:IMS domain-containing protein [Okeania sp. SIO2C9]NEQ75437.1 DUF4101 domain-containing protein [Okeania sp. SIO2C9]